jgi:hypothetical protein
VTPALALLLFLNAVVAWCYGLTLLDNRREDALWAQRRRRLLALNRVSPSQNGPEFFSLMPGAIWPVDTHAAVYVAGLP